MKLRCLEQELVSKAVSEKGRLSFLSPCASWRALEPVSCSRRLLRGAFEREVLGVPDPQCSGVRLGLCHSTSSPEKHTWKRLREGFSTCVDTEVSSVPPVLWSSRGR